MNIRGKDVFFYGLAGLGIYIVYRVLNFGDSITDAAASFWEGVTFDPDSMGPPAQLTEGAQLSQADWIAQGYLAFTPEGGTRITAAGEAYIQRQREKVVTGQVVN